MRKAKNFIPKDGYKKAFKELFISLAERHGRFEVWSDFVTMTACSISNSSDKRFYDDREKMYLTSAKRYNREELEKIAALFSIVVMALDDNPEQDFLGEMFSGLNLHNEWHGQFFTPYHIGSFMAAINLIDAGEQLKQKEVITVNDCCCGAGCLLIAFANEARKAGIDFQSRIVFVAQDVDFVAAMMCYIQLSLLGCKAIVKVGNSLTDPFVPPDMENDTAWYSPMYACESIFKLFSLTNNNMEVTTNGTDENSVEGCKGVEREISA